MFRDFDSRPRAAHSKQSSTTQTTREENRRKSGVCIISGPRSINHLIRCASPRDTKRNLIVAGTRASRDFVSFLGEP